MNTQLVNLRKCRHTSFVRIDRLSQFGNPYHIGKDGDRSEVIRKYRRYFYRRLRRDKKFKWAVQDLKGLTLACWCTPKPCHGDVIIEYLDGLAKH